jgi:hypothetical protein
MEKNTLQQKLEIASFNFPMGTKVCNFKIGTVGEVSGKPFAAPGLKKIFIPVVYEEEHLEDAEMIFSVKVVKKDLHENI